jgi:serine/threonine-protein kinase RsbW
MQKHQLVITNKLPELEKLTRFLDAVAAEWQLHGDACFQLNLVLEEVVTNIIFYGYDDAREDHICIDMIKKDDSVTIVISDRARAFNPLQVPLPDDLDKPLRERKVGGLGILFIRTLLDEISYQRVEGNNILTLVKNIKSLV